jgi:hypothetical protein
LEGRIKGGVRRKEERGKKTGCTGSRSIDRHDTFPDV